MSPLKHLQRYWRAFVGALRMTLRGEVAQTMQERYPHLSLWLRSTVKLTDAACAAADANGLPKAAREAFKLRIEGRDVSMETILATVRFHADQELPTLMRRPDDFNYVTLQATLMNDHFLVSRLAQAESLPADVRAAVNALTVHVQNLPKRDAL